jgi:hypothetical protein
LCHFHTTNVHLLFVIPNIKWKIIKKNYRISYWPYDDLIPSAIISM